MCQRKRKRIYDRLNKVASRIKDLIQKGNLWTGQVIHVDK